MLRTSFAVGFIKWKCIEKPLKYRANEGCSTLDLMLFNFNYKTHICFQVPHIFARRLLLQKVLRGARVRHVNIVKIVCLWNLVYVPRKRRRSCSQISCKIAIFQSCKFVQTRLRHNCFPVNFATFLRKPSLQNISG